jgi:hypothetical protein
MPSKIDESKSSDGEETNESESDEEEDEELQEAQPPRASRSASAAMVRQDSPSADSLHAWFNDNVENVDHLDEEEYSLGTIPSEDVLEIPVSVWDLTYGAGSLARGYER